MLSILWNIAWWMVSSPSTAGPLIAHEWKGLPQKVGGGALLSGIISAAGSVTATTHL